MKNENFGFEDLWKKVREIKNEIRMLVKSFPPDEKYKLTDQITRSVRSINALLSEGHGRFTYPDQLHFCVQARGSSLAETVNHLYDALDEEYISQDVFNQLKNKAKEIERMLNGYIIFLRKKRDETNS
ncbi:MAG: four helix bundle protein [Ferruginibacter sp.]